MAVAEPVHHRGHRGRQSSERHLRPFVGPALKGERRPKLRGDHRVRDEEEDRGADEPDDDLSADGGPVGDKVQADDGGGGEEHDVRAPKDLLQLPLLRENERAGYGRSLGRQLLRLAHQSPFSSLWMQCRGGRRGRTLLGSSAEQDTVVLSSKYSQRPIVGQQYSRTQDVAMLEY
jgi:hypothetical protein